MKSILLISQIILSVSLIGIILLQSSKGGLGSAFGGGGEFRSRRGAEKLIFRFTIVLVCLFLIISVTNLIVR